MGRLSGTRVVITRAAHQCQEFASLLQREGAQVLLLPMIAIVPPHDSEPLRRAASSAAAYDWIIFASSNAVDAFAGAMDCSPSDLRARIAVVGAGTRQHAEARGFTVALAPEEFVSEALVKAFGRSDLPGSRVLIPASAIGRDILPAELRSRGAIVEVVEAYRNGVPPDAARRAAEVLREPFPNWITFASPSAIDHLMKITGAATLQHSRIASIGPVTSTAIRKHALPVHVEADPHTVEGLVNAMASFNQET